MEVLRHSSDKVSKLEGTVEYYKKKLEDANHRRNGLETENRLINQRVMQGQVEELQKDLQEQALKADDSAMLEKKNQEYMDKLRELNDELLKKSAYIDDMEPKYNANTQHVDELEEALKRKEDHESMQDMNRLRATRSRASTAEQVEQRVLQVLNVTQHSIPDEMLQTNREEEVQVSRDESSVRLAGPPRTSLSPHRLANTSDIRQFSLRKMSASTQKRVYAKLPVCIVEDHND
ncbi:hypothetical protein CRUP_032435, partial [Coryphaenoides rupestris]